MTFRFFKILVLTYLPQPLISFLKKIRHQYYIRRPFHHKVAQRGEMEGAERFMLSGNTYMELVGDVKALQDRKVHEHLMYSLPYVKDFFRDVKSYRNFSEEIKDKRCLEIGSGPIGLLPLLPWIKERIIIDPLLDGYRTFQLEHFGKTFFTDDMKLYSQEAEKYIQALEHSVTGFIFSRNTLDHCENPWLILEHISRYAVPGCKLLLWTDLWHLQYIDEKHRNIIRDSDVFENKLVHLGFRIESRFS